MKLSCTLSRHMLPGIPKCTRLKPLIGPNYCLLALSARAAGLLTIMMTESPLRNILLTYRSLFTAVPLECPFPPVDVSVHISFTSSNNLSTKLEWIQSQLMTASHHQHLQIHMSIIRLHSSEKFVIVPHVHHHLRVVTNGPVQDTEGSRFQVSQMSVSFFKSWHVRLPLLVQRLEAKLWADPVEQGTPMVKRSRHHWWRQQTKTSS